MAKIKVPTKYIEVDTDKLTNGNLNVLLSIYSQISDVQAELVKRATTPVKEEIIKVLSHKIIC